MQAQTRRKQYVEVIATHHIDGSVRPQQIIFAAGPIYDVEANMGDVMLAGIGTGLLTYEEVKKWQVLDEKIMPNEENHKKYNEYFRLYKSIYEHLKEDMKELTEVR